MPRHVVSSLLNICFSEAYASWCLSDTRAEHHELYTPLLRDLDAESSINTYRVLYTMSLRNHISMNHFQERNDMAKERDNTQVQVPSLLFRSK